MESMTTFNLHDERILENCIQLLKREGLGQEVKIGPIRKSRQAENYFHACVKIIGDHIGEAPEETKLRIKYSVLPLKEIRTANGTVYLYPTSTADLSKGDYSKLIDATLMLGNELGLIMPTPDYYGLTKEEK